MRALSMDQYGARGALHTMWVEPQSDHHCEPALLSADRFPHHRQPRGSSFTVLVLGSTLAT